MHLNVRVVTGIEDDILYEFGDAQTLPRDERIAKRTDGYEIGLGESRALRVHEC